jgi:ribonuclease P protein component
VVIHNSHKKRLSNPSEFKAVFQAGRKISSCHFAIHFKKNQCANSRLGIIIAKRNIRKAVLRNRIKRIVRESFRLNQSELGSLDVIIVVYSAFASLTRQMMRKKMDEVWRKIP